MIDPFHLEAYGKTTVNYNRDVEIFPVLNTILEKISGKSVYKSPTDMGVNMAGNCITDDEIVREAAKEEIIRRYYDAVCAVRKGLESSEVVARIELLMNQLGISATDRKCVGPCLEKANATNAPATAIELPDGKIITGKTSSLLGAASAMLINALKTFAGIPDEIMLISPTFIEPIQHLKVDYMGNHNPRLHVSEVLIALTIAGVTNPTVKKAIDCLPMLRGLDMHSSVMLSDVDIQTFKKLGIRVTCEPKTQTKKLYYK